MQIYTTGKSVKLSRRELRYAVNWMGNLILKRLADSITVTISYEPLKDLKGTAELLDKIHSPRKFKIRLDPRLSRSSQLKTLAHELVHVKQYARNELKDYPNRASKWKDKVVHEENTHYYDLPWEIEATGMEFGVYMRYIEHLDRSGLNF